MNSLLLEAFPVTKEETIRFPKIRPAVKVCVCVGGGGG